ncbi:MAG: hypothetical protein JRN16_00250 [Nitrososphaerota archaeon]|nr:hypothetical protein [Nitrososphaerota archaeon]MDG6964629.1 hypothetical protein [Nitrososphaerota archaeon]MDG6968706.1 hypothetical protein [Nitrososphaerota archaeon]MDG6974588.1 hypothetical protein [Nitrososphaerota archaeon]MDG7009402.1 hypothetical protein [Nitrososphaerota archaeon]
MKAGLELYVDLWEKAIKRGVVGEADAIDEALAKIERAGGLQKAAGD